MLLAHDNTEKIESRELIVQAIKKHLPNEEIKMFELLGGGVGAKYYDEKLNVKHMTLVETKTALYNAFSLDNLKAMALKHHCTAHNFFEKFPQKKEEYSKHFFNVMNLDFCAWLYDNGQSNSTAQIINKMFASKAVKPGGLAFFTFMVNGFTLDLHKIRTNDKVPTEPGEIIADIAKIANANGYHLNTKEPILVNKYHSRKEGKQGRGFDMMNIGLKIAV